MICTKCNNSKNVEEFRILKGYSLSFCKSCEKGDRIIRGRTIPGLLNMLLGGMRSSSKSRGHKPPPWTLLEFKYEFENNAVFLNLYKLWKNSNYSKGLKPSVDRLNIDKGYSRDNLRFISWSKNRTYAVACREDGSDGVSTPIQAFNELTKEVLNFPSISSAARYVGVSQSSISIALKRKVTKYKRTPWVFDYTQ